MNYFSIFNLELNEAFPCFSASRVRPQWCWADGSLAAQGGSSRRWQSQWQISPTQSKALQIEIIIYHYQGKQSG